MSTPFPANPFAGNPFMGNPFMGNPSTGTTGNAGSEGADPMDALGPLLDLLAGWEAAADAATQATLKDPAAVKANGQAFAAFAKVSGSLPWAQVEVEKAEVGDTIQGLGRRGPEALLAATRLGWATAVGSLLPFAIGRGANPMVVGPELAALQAALYAEPTPPVATTPRTLVRTEGSARLWQLSEGEPDATPVVVIASLINRHYLLDLMPGQSLLAALPGPLYLVDWTVGDEDLEGLLARLADLLAPLEKVRLLGYSMGGTIAAIHSARHPDTIEKLAVFAAPIDASRGGSFASWSESADFDAIATAFTAVPAPFVHAPFWALRPSVNLSKLTQLVRRWRQPGYLQRFLAVELWNNDNVDVSAPLYQAWGQKIYRENALWNGDLADLGAITCPTLAVAAKHDGIVPAAATLALAEKTGGEAITIPSGHVGALSGRRGLEALVSALCAFLETP
jgi:polyhydroxyalkanoate synthase subunit PhaC